ncbi:uncharacterized protein LOC120170516 [Hibiscus syriacus]|uniref:uncharacterized protein LOC120170516 n=1 Tax=Hibiscus syriacus TaxID=106335 RepID=UPI001921D595|nr:uncharacterized protein LOC120170516 [Hibiscus syriacus]
MNNCKGKGRRGKERRQRLGIVEDEGISTKSNGKDSNEAGNNNMSISEAVESQYMKKLSLITDMESDSPVTASTGLGETQNSHVDGDRETFEIGKKAKTHHKKRKKSSNLEHIQTSVDHLDKEHTTGLENGSIRVPDGQAMPVQVSEEELGNSTSTKSDLKERKRKKRKESLCNDEEIETKTDEVIPSPLNLAVTKDDATLTAKASEVALGNNRGTESDLKGRKRKNQKKQKKLKESLCSLCINCCDSPPFVIIRNMEHLVQKLRRLKDASSGLTTFQLHPINPKKVALRANQSRRQPLSE